MGRKNYESIGIDYDEELDTSGKTGDSNGQRYRYTLHIPAKFDDDCRKSLETLMRYQLEHVGTVEEGESIYLDNGEIDYCIIRFSMDGDPTLIPVVAEALEEIALPYGSKLYFDEHMIAEVGTLHHIRVNFDMAQEKPISRSEFTRLDRKISDALDGINVVSSTYMSVPDGIASYFYYVADLDMAMEIVRSFLDRSRFGQTANIEVVDSGMTVQERYMSEVCRVYRSMTLELWKEIQKEWKAITPNDWMQLLRKYPHTPEGVTYFLNMLDGTLGKQFTSLQVPFPMYIHEGKKFYSLSAKEMLTQTAEDLDVLQMALSVAKPKQVRARTSQWDACLLAVTGEGPEASRLYIDYNPTKQGHVGQILLYDGESQALEVVAPSFNRFLLQLLQNGLDAFVDHVVQVVMEKSLSIDLDTIDLHDDVNRLLVSAMASLTDKVLEHVEPPTIGKRGCMGMVMLEHDSFNFPRFKKDLLTLWDISSVTSPEGVQVRAAMARKDIQSITEDELEEAHFLLIDDYKVVIVPFPFAMPSIIAEGAAMKNYLWDDAIGAVTGHTYHVAISIVDGPSDRMAQEALLMKLLSVVSQQGDAVGIYTNGLVYEPMAYIAETDKLRQDELPVGNMIWVDFNFEEDGTVSGHTTGMEAYGKLNIELLHYPWEIEEMCASVRAIAAVVLSLESDVQDGDTLTIDEETKYTVRIAKSVHAEDAQTLQIYVGDADEIDEY